MTSTNSDAEKALGDKSKKLQSYHSTKKVLDASGFGYSPNGGNLEAPKSLAKPKKDMKSLDKNLGLH